jgi:signal transduction histidine kinase
MTAERRTGMSAKVLAQLLCLVMLFALLPLTSASAQQARNLVIVFDHGDYVVGGRTMPTSGWKRATLPVPDLVDPAQKFKPDTNVLWLRLKFDGNKLSTARPMITVVGMNERFSVTLNGKEIYRTDPDPDAPRFTMTQPSMIPIPASSLLNGSNELLFQIRSSTTAVLSVGTISMGEDRLVIPQFQARYVSDFLGPLILTCTLALLTLGIAAFWIARPREQEFGWLTLVGAAWVYRNLHYFIATLPVGREFFWASTVDSVFVLTVALIGFAATYFDIPSRKVIIKAAVIIGFVSGAMRYVLVHNGISDIYCFMPMIPALGVLTFILARAWWQNRAADTSAMLFALIGAIAFSMHDMGRIKHFWEGTGLLLQPYSSILVFTAFAFALGRRFLAALVRVENINSELEDRVNEATQKLTISEAARHKLEMESALEQERERMMREIHDGIGSNLVTALGAAERQHASSETVSVLRRSITDLKIAVDSLEPMDGDIAALLASFRHRLEPELNDAGLTFNWEVEAVPLLDWLDAVNALHVFRILQEAVANIVKHSAASIITVGCRAQIRNGQDGVMISLADDGKGFKVEHSTNGRGLANMASRAQSLHGMFTCEGRLGEGARIMLWLPVER